MKLQSSAKTVELTETTTLAIQVIIGIQKTCFLMMKGYSGSSWFNLLDSSYLFMFQAKARAFLMKDFNNISSNMRLCLLLILGQRLDIKLAQPD
jgi:hypothetical protein